MKDLLIAISVYNVMDLIPYQIWNLRNNLKGLENHKIDII